MQNYQKLYTKLFNAATDALEAPDALKRIVATSAAGGRRTIYHGVRRGTILTGLHVLL